MRLGAISHLVAGSGLQHELSAIGEFGVKLAFQAEQDVALRAPVVGQIARRVIDHPNPDGSELTGSPGGDAPFPGMLNRLDGRPFSGAEGNVVNLHSLVVLETGSADQGRFC